MVKKSMNSETKWHQSCGKKRKFKLSFTIFLIHFVLIWYLPILTTKKSQAALTVLFCVCPRLGGSSSKFSYWSTTDSKGSASGINTQQLCYHQELWEIIFAPNINLLRDRNSRAQLWQVKHWFQINLWYPDNGPNVAVTKKNYSKCMYFSFFISSLDSLVQFTK